MKDESVKPLPFQRFKALTEKLLSVPKKDVDKKEAERPEKSRRKPA